MFLYGSKLPDSPTFAPNFRSEQEREGNVVAQRDSQYSVTRDLQLYRDNANSAEMAAMEAYERRNKAIFEATGVQLENPYRAMAPVFSVPNPRTFSDKPVYPDRAPDSRETAVAAWEKRVTDLQRERPEFASVIAAERPIRQDAAAISRDAERAAANLDTSELNWAQKLTGALSGGIAGMARDPLQVGTLFLGGGSGAGKTVITRLFSMIMTEATVNAGVESVVQAASQSWRKEAGVEHGLTPALKQVGIAGLFGAGFGGLMQGGAEVFRAIGKAAPEEALQRVASGQAQSGDLDAIAAAIGRPLDPETSRVAQLAVEQDELDRAAFGPMPEGVEPAQAERLMADALRKAESPREAPMPQDMQERFEQIERIVRTEAPLGQRPRQPESLIRYLARDGIKDEAGSMSAMGLKKRFIPGRGRLVRESGKSLDYARESAAEAGYFNHLYGTADEAVARSTPDDLLRAIDEELAGNPRYSIQEDGERMAEAEAFQAREESQLRYRRVLEEVDAVRAELELGPMDDAMLSRAARLVDDETDADAALERVFAEDYREWLDDADWKTGADEDGNQFDLPPGWDDERTSSRAGELAGEDGSPDAARKGGADALPGERGQSSGGNEAQAGNLRAIGATPEPGTPQAGELAALARTEAGPVVEIEKPGMWDVIPAMRGADGEVTHTTYASMLDEAERDGFFGDLVASCKD